MKSRRGRHEGAVRQRADGIWEGRHSLGIDAQGKRKRKSVYGPTKQAVLTKLAALQISPPSLEAAERITIAELITTWAQALKASGRRETTLAKYAAMMKHTGAIAGLSAAKVKRQHVELVLAAIEKAPTRETCHAALRALFSFALKRGYIDRHPMIGLDTPRAARTERVRIWTIEEVKRVLDTASIDPWKPWLGVYALALGAGLRRGEIFALRWRDIDLERGMVRIERALSEVRGKLSMTAPKSRASARTVDIPDFAVAALRARRGTAGEDALVFQGARHAAVRRSNFDRRVHRPLCKAAKTPYRTVHELRHTHASLLLAQGENIKLVSTRLGHADVAITLRIYSHLMPGAQASAAKKLDGLLRD